MPSPELNEAMTELGAALGLRPADTEPAVAFARRCTDAARKLRRSAGITWADYELIATGKNRATFALKYGATDNPLGGPRWHLGVAQGLDQLADQLGKYEKA